MMQQGADLIRPLNTPGWQGNRFMWNRLRRKLTQCLSDLTATPPADAVPLGSLSDLGDVAVFAPHPDDESLGCGGLIGLLKRAGNSVHVVVMTDGTGSHPNSQRYPAPRLAALRRDEARAAVIELGLNPGAELAFLGLTDREVPANPDAGGFTDAVDAVAAMLKRWRIDTIVSPLRSDAHDDHRASFRIIMAATNQLDRRPRLLEYGIWGTPGRAGVAVDPAGIGFRQYFIDVSAVLRRKKAAIACHRSQTTDLIDDDPNGFRLSARTIAHFGTRWELFHEAQQPSHGSHP
jgi:LmbE family N-acetylglucosaminyl deacetylase